MKSTEKTIFVDATYFLGMHDIDGDRRQRSVDFFSANLNRELYMNLEQVGLCDHVIWQRNREEQDAYYPFMDNLHTLANIQRLGYRREELRCALTLPELTGLTLQQACTLAQVIIRKGILYTHDPGILDHSPVGPWLAGAGSAHSDTPVFPEFLESLYRSSTQLTLTLEGSCYV